MKVMEFIPEYDASPDISQRIRAMLVASPEMRKYKAEDFYDSSLMTELDRSGFLDQLYR